MYFKYGGYTHTSNEVDLTMMRKSRFYSKRNRVIYERRQLILEGHIIASTQATIKTAIDAIHSAYGRDLLDAGLYHDDDTLSPHHLVNLDSINGVRVRSLEWPKGGGAEYATGRTYRIILEADYLGSDLGVDQIYSFTEVVRIIGTGGPAWELVPRFLGPPVPRVLYNQTPQRIIQYGEAVGVQAYPIQPAPWLIDNEHRDKRVIERRSPMKIGVHQNLLYPLKYRYEFSLINPVAVLLPHRDY